MASGALLVLRNLHVVVFYYAAAGALDLIVNLLIFALVYFRAWTTLLGVMAAGVFVIYLPIRESDFVKKAYYTFFDEWLQGHKIYWDDESYNISDGGGSSAVNSKAKYLFTYHPHGSIALAAQVHGNTHPSFLRKKMAILSHSNLFLIPITSVCVRLLGSKSSRAESMKKIMNRGHRYLSLIPGGGDEMLFSGEQRVDMFYLMNRRGFIKYALQYGYSLVPVYTVNENELFTVYSLPRETKRARRINTTVLLMFHFIFVHGWFWFTFLPKRIPLRSYIGSVLSFPHIEDPTVEQIDMYHKKYVDALLELRKKHPRQSKKVIIM